MGGNGVTSHHCPSTMSYKNIMENIKTYIVDSFTDKPFKGNPAGVCLLKEDLTDSQMLDIAKELGLSETAFVKQTRSDNEFSIRYFSPKMEIPLCGHATLAASKVVFQNNPNKKKIVFQNFENLRIPTLNVDQAIIMEFPIYETTTQGAPIQLLNALGISEIINSVYNEETKILLLEIDSDVVLQNLRPNYSQLKESHKAINGVLVTALSSKPDYDFESRYFWPWSGTDEDPVTGGTHTFLAPYWGKKLDKTKLKSFQCSERSGFMEVELVNQFKMTIKSEAQIVLKGELRI